MSYEGQDVKVLPLDDGFVELRFDLSGESVNKFNAPTLGELRQAVADLRARREPRGLLITSGKDVFCVGADVTEFLSHFGRSEEELARWLLETDAVFSAIEDLNAPSVVATTFTCRKPWSGRAGRPNTQSCSSGAAVSISPVCWTAKPIGSA